MNSKQSRTTKIVVIALFVAIVTAIIIAGTFAKYTTKVEGQGTATVAHWSFSADGYGATEQTRVNLRDTSIKTETLQSDRIAPGTEGSFDIVLDPRGSEVGVDYVITLSNVTNKPTNLHFYSDSAYTDNIEEGSVHTISGNIPLSEVGSQKTVTVYWKWAYETTEIATNDPIDTTDGEKDLAGRTMTFDISVLATQADPRP